MRFSVAVVLGLLWSTQATGTASADRTDWSRVKRLSPGQFLRLTVDGSGPLERRMVIADDTVLTVLDLTRPDLPPEVARVCLRLASASPSRLAAASTGVGLEADRVRLDPGGVFVDGRRVAAVADVVQSIRRSGVVEIAASAASRWNVGAWLLSVGAACLAGGAIVRKSGSGPGVVFWTGVPLATVGAVLTLRGDARQGLIYRRP